MNIQVITKQYALIGCALIAMAGTLVTPRAAQAQEQMIGELRLFGFNFCPRTWAAAEGQLLPINQNQALFSLFGTIYGGDGRTTFALPDLRGRAPIHVGQGPGLADYRQGQKGGTESFVIPYDAMPMHSHDVNATNTIADKNGPGGKLLAVGDLQYVLPPIEERKERVMDPSMISFEGDDQPIQKRSPYLAMRWCVALQGIFPSRN